jgi:hypothetical protein
MAQRTLYSVRLYTAQYVVLTRTKLPLMLRCNAAGPVAKIS